MEFSTRTVSRIIIDKHFHLLKLELFNKLSDPSSARWIISNNELLWQFFVRRKCRDLSTEIWKRLINPRFEDLLHLLFLLRQVKSSIRTKRRLLLQLFSASIRVVSSAKRNVTKDSQTFLHTNRFLSWEKSINRGNIFGAAVDSAQLNQIECSNSDDFISSFRLSKQPRLQHVKLSRAVNVFHKLNFYLYGSMRSVVKDDVNSILITLIFDTVIITRHKPRISKQKNCCKIF